MKDGHGPRKVPRGRRALFGALVVVLALGGAVSYALLHRGSTEPLPLPSATPSPSQVPAVVPTGPAVADSSGFEATSLKAAGWSATGAGAATLVTGDEARTGHRGLRVEVGRGLARPATVSRARVPAGQGLQCDVGAWSRKVTGGQLVTVVFIGSGGRKLATSSQAASTGSDVWSRTTVRSTSPAGTAALEVGITGATGSDGRWDDLDVTCAYLPNGGFETADGSDPGQAADWSVIAVEGASARRVTEGAAGHALEVRDDSTTRGVIVRSQPTPVPPGLEVVVSGAVLGIEGDQGVVVRFLDAHRAVLPDVDQVPVRATSGRWQDWAQTLSVPDGARWATVEVVSGTSAQSAARWDDVDVQPAPAARGEIGAAEAVSALKGYVNTTTSGRIVVGGRPLIYTVVSGFPAELQVADLATGRLVDRHVLPGAPTGWAMVTAPDQRTVYLGGAQGHVLRYDPRARTLKDLGRATHRAEVVFSLAMAPDGRVWGGSYPGGELWALDPRADKFTSIEPLREDREYARSLAIQGSTLYVGTGSVNPSVVTIDLQDPSAREEIALPGTPASGFVTELRIYGRLLAAKLPDGTRGVYDLQRRTWDTPVSKDATGRQLTQSPSEAAPGQPFYYFSNGLLWRVHPDRPDASAKVPVATTTIPPGRDRFVVRATIGGTLSDWLVSYDGSQELVAIDVGALPDGVEGKDLPEARLVPIHLRLDPRPLRIKSLGAGSDGVLWAGGFGGASLSSLDTREPIPSLTPRLGGADSGQALLGFGEVEGLAASGPHEFFGTYTGARIFRFDTRRPWVDGQNPALVAHLGPSYAQDRPLGWASSSGRTYFGTVPRYGRRGGVLGWFVGDSTEPTVVPSPVKDQSIVGLAASGSVVYGTTSRWGGLGAKPVAADAAVFAYDTRTGRTLWTTPPRAGLQSAGSVVVDDAGRLFVLMRSELVELDRADGHVVRRFPLGQAMAGDQPTFADTGLAVGAGRLWAATADGLWAVDPGTGSFVQVAAHDVLPSRVQFLADAAYFPTGKTLMRVLVP